MMKKMRTITCMLGDTSAAAKAAAPPSSTLRRTPKLRGPRMKGTSSQSMLQKPGGECQLRMSYITFKRAAMYKK